MIDNIHEDSHIPDSHIPEPKLRDFPAANKDVPLRVRKIGTFGENKIEENIVAQISKTTFDIPKKGFKVWERFADSTKRQENGEVLELTSDQKVDIFYGTYYKEIFSGKKYQPSECIADVTVGEDTRKVIAEDIKEKTYYFIQNSSRFQKVSQYYLYNRLAESMPAILLTMRDNLMTENDQIKYCQEKKSFLTKYVTGNALPHFLPANIAPEIIRGKEDELVNYSNFNAVITGYAEDIRNDNKESIRINNEIAQELLVDIEGIDQNLMIEKLGGNGNVEIIRTNGLVEVANLFYQDFVCRVKQHISLYESREEGLNIPLNYVLKEEIEDEKYRSLAGIITDYKKNGQELVEAKLTSVGLSDLTNLLNQSFYLKDFYDEKEGEVYQMIKRTFLSKLIIFAILFDEKNKS